VIALENAEIAIGARTLLRDVELRVQPGELVALLGANGAGKTTLLRTIAGLYPTRSGIARIDRRPTHTLSARERARALAFVQSDESEVDDISVREAVRIGRYAFHPWHDWNTNAADETAVERALHDVGIASLCERRVRTLSSGERQRVWLALALAQESPILLLDEPTSHLDVRAAHEIMGFLQAQARLGKAVVCAMHDLNEAAAYADRIVLLGEERILADDAPERVLASDAVERAYNVPMERVRSASNALRVFVQTKP
jgi:ABC-type cobalamin/Fe3+-siderophores transport system ATPase subunit